MNDKTEWTPLDLLTVAEASRAAHVKERTVRAWIKRSKLTRHCNECNLTMVARDELLAVTDRRRKKVKLADLRAAALEVAEKAAKEGASADEALWAVRHFSKRVPKHAAAQWLARASDWQLALFRREWSSK